MHRHTASPKAPQERRLDHGKNHRIRFHLARARHRRGHGPGQDAGGLLEARVRGLRVFEAVDEGQQARRHLPRLQRPRHRLQPGDDSHLRHRHGGRVRAGRRRLGAASGAQGDRSPRPGLAHRAVGHPAGLRPHDRQQDGRGPWPDGATVADVWRAGSEEGRLALSGDPVRGQCGAVPGALGEALLHARPGHPQGGRELRRRFERAHLGHRRHEPPAAGRTRRPDQPRVGQRLARPDDQRPGGLRQHAAHRLCARGRQRGH